MGKVTQSSNTSSPTNENESPQDVIDQDGPDMQSVSHLEEMVLKRLRESDFKGDKKIGSGDWGGHQNHGEGNNISNCVKPEIDEIKYSRLQEMQVENVEKLWTSCSL